MPRCGAGSAPGTASPSCRAAPSRSSRARRLPGDPDDAQARYIEAAVERHSRRLHLPAQRQSAARPEVRLQARLVQAARRPCRASCCAQDVPVVLAGDYNVAPTAIDIYPTTSWDDDALVQPQSRAAYARLLEAGLDRRAAPAASRRARSTRSGTTCAIAGSATPGCASITCCSARRSPRASKRPASIAPCAASRAPATTRRCGSNFLCRNRVRGAAASRRRQARPWGRCWSARRTR